MRLGFLDQSPIFANTSAREALIATKEAVRHAEQLGASRFWIAEHHGSQSFAGCAPETLIPTLAEATSSIRIGSGGIMLSHYSPYKVAETFRLLRTLHGDRIDLGIGRAPGGDAWQSGALAYGSPATGPEYYERRVQDLLKWCTGDQPETAPFQSVSVTPGLDTVHDVWALVSSPEGARIAAKLGLPIAIAHFIDPRCGRVSEVYKKAFVPSIWTPKPKILLATFAVCADTESEALERAAPARMWRQRVRSGVFGPFPSRRDAVASATDEADTRGAVGQTDDVVAQLKQLTVDTSADEVLIVTICESMEERFDSMTRLCEAWDRAESTG